MGSDKNDKKNEKPEGDNKVVPFPSHKIRKPNPDMANDPATNSLPGVNPARRRTLVVSLLSVMILATLIASQVKNKGDVVRTTEGRDLASTETPRRDLNEDLMLAKKISHQSLRAPASRGHEPTPEELLAHVELASSYAIQYDKDGGLRTIEFANQPGAEPRRLAQPDDFLMKHQDLFRLSFDKVQKDESIRDNTSLTEIYELRKNDIPVAKVHFKFQNDKELNLMKVELPEDTKRKPADATK